MITSWLQSTIQKASAAVRVAADTMTPKKLDDIHPPVGDTVNKTELDLDSVVDTVKNVTDILLNLVAFLAALYFLYGAFSYIISYGNDAKTTKAKQTMTWAIVGVVVAMLAKFAVDFVKKGQYLND